MKSRKVKLALVQHPNTPRHVSISMLRHLFTFELMQVALTPALAADIRGTAEEALMNPRETIFPEERLPLAYAASARIAAWFLCVPGRPVITGALDNSSLTEQEGVAA